MEKEITKERTFENALNFDAQAHQSIDRNIILRLIEQLLELLNSLLKQEEVVQEKVNKGTIEKIPLPLEIINPNAPFCEPKDPELQRAEIAKGIEKIEEKEQDEQEKMPRQRQRQKGQDLSR